MNYIKRSEVNIMCRICLTQSDNMIPMRNKLDDVSEESPLILDVLEDILSFKIQDDPNYPKEICYICYGNIRILFDLKLLFNKSQNILEKYVSLLTSPYPEECLHNVEDETSKMPIMSTELHNYLDDNDRLSKEVIDITENDFPQVDMPKKIVKLKIDRKEKNNIKVKWVEGNKFILEKNINVSTTVQPHTNSTVHKCSYCHKRFLSKDKLAVHLSNCRKFIVIKCEFCNNKFSTMARLQYHIRVRHSPDTPAIKCDLCDQVFKNYNARSYHKLTRHSVEGKKYNCKLCEKAFYIKNSLNQHMECHSRDVSRVVCPVCGKGFHYRGGLFYHMKVHRNERNYICTFCKRRFLTLASLKRHTRTHTGERPYSCSLCTKTFCSVSEVKTHERRHAGIKPFPCLYCKKSFISPYNLKLHCSSHSGSQPCDFCDKSFLNTEVLKFHMDIKHNMRNNTIKEDT